MPRVIEGIRAVCPLSPSHLTGGVAAGSDSRPGHCMCHEACGIDAKRGGVRPAGALSIYSYRCGRVTRATVATRQLVRRAGATGCTPEQVAQVRGTVVLGSQWSSSEDSDQSVASMLEQARAKKQELERAARTKKEELERQVRARREQLEKKARTQVATPLPVPPAAAASAAVGPAGAAATPAAAETQRLARPDPPLSNLIAVKATPPMPMTAAAAVGSGATVEVEVGAGLVTAAEQQATPLVRPAAAATQSLAPPDPQLSNLIAVKAKSVPTWVIALWFGYVLHTAIMHFVVAPIINSVMDEDNDGDEVTLVTLLVTVGPAVHVTMIPVFCAVAKYYEQSENKRRAELIKKAQREGRHVSIEDMREAGGRTIFFSAKLTLKEKIITGVLGVIIDIVRLILSFMPTDLSNFWFPEPFYLFWRAKLQTRHYRILGAELRLNASMADGYFLWCYEALFNFYTFHLYGMCYGTLTHQHRSKAVARAQVG